MWAALILLVVQGCRISHSFALVALAINRASPSTPWPGQHRLVRAQQDDACNVHCIMYSESTVVYNAWVAVLLLQKQLLLLQCSMLLLQIYLGHLLLKTTCHQFGILLMLHHGVF